MVGDERSEDSAGARCGSFTPDGRALSSPSANTVPTPQVGVSPPCLAPVDDEEGRRPSSPPCFEPSPVFASITCPMTGGGVGNGVTNGGGNATLSAALGCAPSSPLSPSSFVPRIIACRMRRLNAHFDLHHSDGGGVDGRAELLPCSGPPRDISASLVPASITTFWAAKGRRMVKLYTPGGSTASISRKFRRTRGMRTNGGGSTPLPTTKLSSTFRSSNNVACPIANGHCNDALNTQCAALPLDESLGTCIWMEAIRSIRRRLRSDKTAWPGRITLSERWERTSSSNSIHAPGSSSARLDFAFFTSFASFASPSVLIPLPAPAPPTSPPLAMASM